jgi:hypothetical protein
MPARETPDSNTGALPKLRLFYKVQLPEPGDTVPRQSAAILHPFQVCIAFLALCPLALSQQPKLSGAQKLNLWKESRSSLYMNDFGELARYRSANAALTAPANGENRVVFFGDSITDGWHIAEYFPGKPYVNRGISGQTTSQMLVRFRDDVINLKPKAVASSPVPTTSPATPAPSPSRTSKGTTRVSPNSPAPITFAWSTLRFFPSTSTPNKPATCSRNARPTRFAR